MSVLTLTMYVNSHIHTPKKFAKLNNGRNNSRAVGAVFWADGDYYFYLNNSKEPAFLKPFF